MFYNDGLAGNGKSSIDSFSKLIQSVLLGIIHYIV